MVGGMLLHQLGMLQLLAVGVRAMGQPKFMGQCRTEHLDGEIPSKQRTLLILKALPCMTMSRLLLAEELQLEYIALR